MSLDLVRQIDPLWLRALRGAHVAAGAVTFVMAPLALATVKGSMAHRRWGKIYFASMIVATVTAVIAAWFRSNAFLTFVSIFSFYLAFNGFRVLSRKQPHPGRSSVGIDAWVVGGTLVVSLVLVVLGLWQPNPAWAAMGTLSVVFGIAGTVLTGSELQAMFLPTGDRQRWWYTHMTGMVGSYIAALTAFSVTTLAFLPPLVRWLWPMGIGLPALAAWIRYYQRKFRRPR